MAEFDNKNYSGFRKDLREKFFQLIDKLAPEVCEKLSDVPLAECKKLYFAGEIERRNLRTLFRYFEQQPQIKECSETDAAFLKRLENCQTLLDALNNWAQEFNLQTDWVLCRALSQMLLHIGAFDVLFGGVKSQPIEKRQTDSRLQLAYSQDISPKHTFSFSSNLFKDRFPFFFELLPWQFLKESEKDYREKANARFTKYLNNYLREVTEFAEQKGFSHIPRKDKPELHLTWLVAFRVRRMTQGRIAEEFKGESWTSEQSIGEAVQSMAKAIDLPSRVAPKGRRKTKEA